jgi:type I restriction enzyme S subunit
MKECWKVAVIGDLPLQIGDGNYSSKYPKSSEFLPSGVPFITASDLVDGRIRSDNFRFISPEQHQRLRKGHLKSGDILVVTRGNGVGAVAFVDKDYEGNNINAQLVSLRTDENELHNRFLYYLLSSSSYEEILKTFGTGSAQPQIPIWSLKRIQLKYPPFDEQRAIAHILGTLDDRIELNRRMNETLEAMAQALFEKWFFAATQDELPKGWHIESIYTAADVVYGAPFSSTQFNTDRIGKPLIRIRDLADEAPEVFTPEEHPKGYLVKPGDIVVGMDGEFRAHLWGGEESWLNQRVCVFAPKPGFSAPFVMNTIAGLLAEVEATETATTVIHLGKNDIDRFKIVVPDERKLTEFNQITEPLFRKIVLNKQESRTLAALRDALLPKLLSGELRVPAAVKELACDA